MKMIKFLTATVVFMLATTVVFGQSDDCGLTSPGADVTDQYMFDNTGGNGNGFVGTGLTGITTTFYEFVVNAGDEGAYEVQITAGALVEDWAFTIVGGTGPTLCDIDFAAAGAYSYTDAGDLTTPDAICYEQGSYTIAIATSNGEQGEITIDFVALGTGPLTLSETVTELQMPPDADDTDQSICEGQEALIEIFPSDGVPGYTYMWETLPSTLPGTPIGSETTFDVTVDPGLYQVTVTDDAGCTATTQIDIQQMTNPTASDTELTLCEDAEGSGVADFDFSWAEDAGAMENTGGVDVTDGQGGVTTSYHTSMTDAEDETGTYINGDGLADGDPVWVRVEDANGCFAVAEVTIVVEPIPVTADQVYTVCEANFNSSAWGTGNFTLSTMDALVDVAGGNTVTYWELLADAQAGTGIPLSNALYNNTSNPQIIYARVEDPLTGCFNTAEVELVVLIIPDIDPVTTPQEYCNGEAIPDMVFTSTVNDPVVTTGYAWTSTVDVGFGTSGTGQIVGQTAINTGSTPLVTTLTIQPYNFGPNTGDDFGMPDDCFDASQAIDVMITVNPSPANDDCDDAEMLDNTSTFPLATTNICATVGTDDVGDCVATQTASVWYTYTVGADAQDLTITVDLANGSITTYFDPANPTTTDCTTAEDQCDDTGTLVMDCVSMGDVIYIAVNSDAADAADFNLTITEGLAPILGDVCTTAIYADDGTGHILECDETATLVYDPLACPDDPMASTACGPVANVDPGIWWYFEVAADVTEFDITGAGTYELFSSATQDDCSAMTSMGCAGPFETTGTFGYFVWFTGGDLTLMGLPVEVNEDCAMATTAVVGTTPGNNTCASAGTACQGGNADHVVYFTYTTGATPEDITISLAASTTTPAMTDGSIMVFEDCAGTTTNVVDWDLVNMSGEACDGITGAEQVVLNCVPPLTELIISVGSDDVGINVAPAEAGHFDLTIDVEDATVPNDLCADAEDALTSTNLTNICANPEATDCGLDGTTSHDVWYTYTPTGTAEDLTITISADATNGTAATQVSVGVYDNTTACSLDPLDACDASLGFFCSTLDTPFDLNCVTGPIVFYVGSNDTEEGDFTISIVPTVVTLANDACATPDPLAAGDYENTCATLAGGEPTYCGLDNTSHDVWYSYTNSSGSNEDLEITVTSSTAVSGVSATDIDMVVLFDDCATFFTGTDGMTYCDVLDGAAQMIECIPDGTTIHIAFGSPDCSQGDFNIAFTATANGVTNDECDGTLPDATPTVACVFENFCTDNTNACPEDWMFTGCGDTSMDPTVYMEFTPGGNVTSVEIENITGPGTPSLIILDAFTDCTVAPTSISNCLQGAAGTGGTAVPVTAGTTYYILVTSDMEGQICFDIKLNEVPSNDLCADADVLTTNTALAGTTVCATSDVTSACPAADYENTVWYEWTADADYAEVTIDVTSYTPVTGADQIAITVLDNCTSLQIQNDINNMALEYCGASGTELISIPCVVDGDTYTILLSSSLANEGTFDITITEVIPDAGCDDNDQCDSNDADPFSAEVITNDPAGPVCATICNSFACPDDEIDALCAGTAFNTVFYTFTTDGDAALSDGTQVFLNIDLPGGTIANSVIMVLEGGCGGYTFLQQAAGGDYGCFAGPQGPVEVTGELAPNTTYTVVIGTTDNIGGTDDLCIEITTGCVNDECVNSITLDENTVVSTQTNACTMDANSFDCTGLEVASAWYTFTLPAGFSGANITIGPDGSGNAYSVQVFDGAVGCGVTSADLVEGGIQCGSPTLIELTCLTADQDYHILVGTEDAGGEIAFDIEVDFLTPTEAGAPVNDICEGAIVISGPDCEVFTVTADNNKACPDAGLDATGCDFGVDPTIWLEITIPPDGYGLFIENLSADTYVALLDACPATSFFNTNGGAGCVNGGMDTWPVTENTTYYMVVGNPNQGAHTFDLTILVSPPGDEITDPYDLGGGSYAANTCCANGGNPGTFENPNGEPTNLDCNTTFDDHTVWMVYTPPAGVDAVEFIYAGVNASMEIYSGPPGGPYVLINGASLCASTGGSIILPYCDDTEEFLVKVSTADDDCGDITVQAKEYVPCDYADVCEETDGEFSPVTNPDGFNIQDFVCVNGCLEVACPDNEGSCGYDQIPTVWFQVDIDDEAAQMYVNVTTDGGWDPVFSIFEGTCPGGLTEVGTAATPNCNTGWPDGPATDQISQPVDPTVQTTYWIAVGADNFEVGDDPTFEICVLTTINLIICLGDESCEPDAEFEITSRSNDEDGSLGLPLDGPFCQGETVEICVEFFYDASETGVDWLIGLIPIFGAGWDLATFDGPGTVVTGNGMAAQWYDDNVPILQEPLGHMCTFTDNDGNFQICNALCGPCPDCNNGLDEGDPMPGGWFWVTNGGNAGCDNDGTPGEGWGIGSTQATVTFCLELTVKEFADETECEANNDLSFGFQTFSDGVAGCWEDPVGECLLDQSQIFPNEAECEVPPATDGGPDEICNKATSDLQIVTVDGSTVEIIVTAINNPNITGATDWNFPAGDGFGTIADVLCNDTGVEQTQIYEAYTVIPGLTCPGPVTEHEVIVYPDLEVEFVLPFDPMPICYDDDRDFEPNVIGGTGSNYTYDWTDGSSDEDINIENPGDYAVGVHTMCVTVTDDLGCMGEDCFDFEILPEILIEITGENELCIDCDEGDPDVPDVIITYADMTMPNPIIPTGLNWTIDELDGGDLAVVQFGDELWIYDCLPAAPPLIPVDVNSTVGEFEIVLVGSDQFGCMFESEPFLFTVIEGPPINITQLSCDATGSDYTISSPPIQDTKIDICDASDPTTILFTIFGEGDVTLAPGNYIVKSNFTGTTCGSTEDLVVTLGPPAVIDAPPICIGVDGVATVVNCGDYATIDWTDSDTGCSYSISGLTMDSTFVITLTDPSGCEGFANVTIPVNANPDPMMTGLVEFCTGSSSTLGLDDTYTTYDWSTTDATPTITVTTGGTYTVTVTDANGCTGETSLTVSVGDLIVQDGSQEICEDDTATFSVGDTPGFTYQWSDASGPIGGETTFEFTTGVAGVYTCEVTDPAVVGCSGIGTFTLTTTPLPVIDLTVPDTACNDSQGGNTLINLSNYEGLNNDPGTWSDDAAIFGGAFDPLNLNFDGFALGNYTFTYTTTANGECEPISQSLMITVIECSCPVQVGPIPDICTNQPESIDLDAREFPVDAGEWTIVGTASDLLIVNANGAGSLLDVPVTTAAGVYTLQYTLPGFNPECSETVSFEVFEQPFAELAADQPICNDASSGGDICLDFSLLVTGGDTGGTWVEDPQYVTDFGAVTDWTNVCFNGLDEGATYEFTYTTNSAAGPCNDVEYTLDVDVEDCQCKDPSTLEMPTVCAEAGNYALSGFIALTADPGTWSFTGLGTGDESTITLTTTEIIVSVNTTPGTYVFQYDNINPTGGSCVEFSQQTLTVVAPPTAAMTQPDVQACSAVPAQTGSIDNITDIGSFLDPSSDAGVWSDNAPNGGLLAGGQSINAIDTDGIPVGTIITFTYTTTTGAGDPCDDVFATIDLIVIDCDCPPVDTEAPNNFCTTGGSQDLAPLEGNSDDGTWTVTGAPAGVDLTTLNIVVGDMLTIDMNTVIGTYELTFTLDNPVPNCLLTSTTETFEVYAPPMVSFEPATACNEINTTGSSVDNVLDLTEYFGAGSSTNGTWSSTAEANGLDLSVPTSVDFEGLMPFSPITIEFTTNNATDPCIDVTGLLVVTVIDCTLPPCPDLTVENPEPVCNDGATVDLSLSETANTVSGSWSEDPGNPTLGILANGIVTIDASTVAATYTFIFTPDIMPVAPCPETNFVELVVSQAVDAGIDGETDFCDSEVGVVDLFLQLTDADTGGTWSEISSSGGGAFDPNAGTFTIDGQAPGLYEFAYTLTAAAPCTDDNSVVSVTINADPIAEAGPTMQLDCSGDPLTLDGSGSSIGADFTYEWSQAGTVLQSGTDTDYSTSQDGTYTLTVINDITGCTSSDDVVITLDPAIPVLEAVPCTDMGEGIIFLTNMSGINTPFTLEIVDSQGNIQLVENAQDLTEVSGLDPDLYDVTLIDAIGCRSVAEPLIIVSAESIINNEAEADTVEFGTLYTLDVNEFLVNGVGTSTIEWFDEDGNILCQQPPNDCTSYEVLVERAQYICLRVTDELGCVNEDCIWLRFRIDNQVFTPNIFDPNGEENAWVYPQTDKTAMIPKFSVFDRWGNLIFVRENFDSNIPELGWDGSYNGANAEQGVYVYLYDAIFPNGEVKSVAQDVTLIR